MEDRSGWLQVLGLEAELGHRVAVEDVDADAALDEDSGELACAPRDDGVVEDEGVTTRVLEICPRGNNKWLLSYFFLHGNCLLFML